MKKVFVAVFIIAVLEGVLAKTECNKLLNCKECVDETHCETCLDGYYLDAKSVCRINCTKFGQNCPYCSATRCICPNKDQEWNEAKGVCQAKKDCSSSDPAVCTYCGFGFDLIDFNGKCSTCAAVFGTGCVNCTESHCTGVAEGYKLVGAVSVASSASDPTSCSALFPGCSTCNSTGNSSVCTACGENAELVGSFCKYKKPSCDAGQIPLYIQEKMTCGTCQTFDANCVPSRCSGHGCTMCKTGFAVTAAGGCINCSSTFPGCGMCQEDACTRCRSSTWILTPNGCFNQNPYVPPEESNAGLIAGIVVGALVVVALLILAIYCIVTSSMKSGQIDPSLYEDDLEFKSVSVL